MPGDRAKVAAVIYNRLHAGMALGIDATILYHLGSWTATDPRVRPDRPRAVQHPHPQGPAADADLQSRVWPRCRRPPTRRPRRLPVLRGHPGQGGPVLHVELRGLHGARRIGGRPPPGGRDRPSGGALALAGDAHGRLPGARPRLGVHGDRRAAGRPRGVRRRARRVAGFAGVNVTIPHKQAVLDAVRRALRRRPPGRVGEHRARARRPPARRDDRRRRPPVGAGRRRAGRRARARRGRRGPCGGGGAHGAGWRVAVSARRPEAAAELGVAVQPWPPARGRARWW